MSSSTAKIRVYIVTFTDNNTDIYSAGPFIFSTKDKANQVVIDWCEAVIRREMQNMDCHNIEPNLLAVLSTFDCVYRQVTFRKGCDVTMWIDAVEALNVGKELTISNVSVTQDENLYFNF